MSTIPPAPPPMPAPAPAGAGTAAVATVAGAIPDAVKALPAGTQIEVVALTRALKGMVEVLAEGRPMNLRLPPDLMALPGGSRMVLQVYQSGGETQFRIVSLNGRPILPGGVPLVNLPPNLPAPAAGGPPPSPTTVPAAPSQGAAPAASSPVAPAPAGITATLLRPAPAGAAPSPATANLPADLPPGTQVTVRIAGTAPAGAPPPLPASPVPAAAPPPPAASPTPPAPTPMPPPAGAASAAAGATPQPAAGTGQPATPPPTAPVAPATATPSAPPPGPPLLTGTVIAHPPGGNAVVQTPAGTLSLPAPANLPPGSQLLLEVVGRPEFPRPPAAAARPDGLTAGGWPALDEAATILARSDAQAAEQFLRAIPQANARLAASMAMFASTLRSGDVRQILTDAVTRGLERAGKRDTADRLKGDIEKLSADSARPLGGGEWRALTMPFLNGAQIEAIRLYVRHAADEDPESGRRGRGDGERFVLEVSMTRLGRVQLDGLVQRADKQFDLIVRTERPLPDDMRRDIMAIFTENAEVCGTRGMVGFQSGRFVDLPPPDAPAATTLSV